MSKYKDECVALTTPSIENIFQQFEQQWQQSLAKNNDLETDTTDKFIKFIDNAANTIMPHLIYEQDFRLREIYIPQDELYLLSF